MNSKQRISSAFALVMVIAIGAHAAELKGPNCPEIPAGAIVLGRYCPPTDTRAAMEPEAKVEAKVEGKDPLLQATTHVAAMSIQSVNTPVESPSVTVPQVVLPQALYIRQGDRLMPVLKSWLASQSIELVWAASASTSGRVRDVVLEDDFQASSTDVREALIEILEPFGFEAEFAKNKGAVMRVTVRNSRNGL